MKKFIVLILASIFLYSCEVTPYSPEESARATNLEILNNIDSSYVIAIHPNAKGNNAIKEFLEQQIYIFKDSMLIHEAHLVTNSNLVTISIPYLIITTLISFVCIIIIFIQIIDFIFD
jgi:hypothetical protein